MKRTAAELLMAAQIAQAVGGPHAKDLVRAAAEKAPAEADILMGAYMQATSAGWEGESIAGGGCNAPPHYPGRRAATSR